MAQKEREGEREEWFHFRAFGGWEKAYKDHFAEGAIYDKISQK